MRSPDEYQRSGPLFAAALAVASHAPALGGGYVWLDHAHLEEGLALAAPSRFWTLFTQGFAGTGFYRPLLALSLSFDALVSKTPGYFHAITLGLHALAAALLVVAAEALGLSRRAALVAGLLFAVHPATTLVASAIAFRSEAMSLVFLLILIIAHRKGRAFSAAGAMMAGALTKETAWLLGPLFIVALERSAFLTEGSSRRDARWRRVLWAEALAFVACCLLRLAYAPEFRASHVALPLGEALGSRLSALAKGLATLLLPVDGSICDAFPATPLFAATALIGGLCLGGVLLLARRGGVLAWLFALALLPALQIVPSMRFWSPHYFYLPLAFGASLLADFADRQLRALPLAAAAVALPCALASLERSRRYESDLTLWAPEVTAQPACREGHFFLGEVARRQQEFQRAAFHYQHAARPLPGYLAYADEFAALENLGAVWSAEGRAADAREAWETARARVRDAEQRRRITHNLAVLALRSGDAERAVDLLEPESQTPRPLAESLLVRAKALHDLGREAEARQTLQRLGVSLNVR